MLHRNTLSILSSFALLFFAGCGGSGGGTVAPGGGSHPTASTPIGVAGGTATSADGMVVLTIPAGALGNTEAIEITKVEGADIPAQLAAIGATDVYRFEPDGLAFAAPVILEFDLGAPDVPTPGTVNLSLAQPVGESGGILDHPSGSALIADATSQSLLTRISHFSHYGVQRDTATNAGFTILHPTELGFKASGTVALEFLQGSTANSFIEWSFQPIGLSFDEKNFKEISATNDISFDIQCDQDLTHTAFVGMTYDTTDDGGVEEHTVSYNFGVLCGSGPIVIDTETLLDIQLGFGHTGVEEINLPRDACQAGIWVGTDQGGVRLGLVGTNEFQLETSFLSNSPITDVSPFENGVNGESAYLATGAGDSFIIRNEPWGCTPFPGANLTPIYRDTTPFEGGIISADAFANQLTVSSIPDGGGLSTTSYTTSNFYRTAVSNDDGSAFVGVEFSPTRLTHMTVANGAVQQENPGPILGSDPRRMKWNSASGLGAVTDFVDSTVTLFLWEGGAAPPKIIDTVAVGSGPVGVDVYRNNVACTGFFDDTLSIIKVDLGTLEVLSVDTEALEVENPRGKGIPVNPAHVIFAPYMGNRVLAISLYGADSLLFLPDAY